MRLLGTAAVLWTAWVQERGWESIGQIHPFWWMLLPWGLGILLLILVGWVLLSIAPVILAIIAALFGLRWLVRATAGRRSDPAVAILRERYARGEIRKDEFDAKMRDLAQR